MVQRTVFTSDVTNAALKSQRRPTPEQIADVVVALSEAESFFPKWFKSALLLNPDKLGRVLVACLRDFERSTPDVSPDRIRTAAVLLSEKLLEFALNAESDGITVRLEDESNYADTQSADLQTGSGQFDRQPAPVEEPYFD